MTEYKPVIGLEIHVELKTESGMFCQCKIGQFADKSNRHVCPVCLGLPGSLPVPNKKAIEWAIKIGKALNCHINLNAKFDRKHYTYPDLPKGYQISQYDEPMATGGWLKVRSQEKKFRIHRVHLEEDTGKLIHLGGDTLVDFNRSGTPLVEIVTEPDFNSSDDAKMFLEELHTIIRYLDVSDADMEKGTMRLEPNISVRTVEMAAKNELPKYKVEVKNINSFNFVKKAIDYEVKRHIEILERGETPVQETRGYVEADSSTISQRSKEEAHDYRYFPEPDIPPLRFTKEFIDSITVPELPNVKVARYVSIYKIRLNDAHLLTRDKKTAEYIERCFEVKASSDISDLPQKIANAFVNRRVAVDLSPVEFVQKVIELSKPKTTNMGTLSQAVSKVIFANSKVVEDIKKGKEGAIMFLVGQVMREMKGQADAIIVKQELIKGLK